MGSNIDADVALQSNLFQTGILYGRRFELKNPKIELRLEFSASANMFSKSKFFIEGIETNELSELIDNELKLIYKDYT